MAPHFSFLPIFPVTQDKLVTFTSFFDLSFAASWTRFLPVFFNLSL